MNYEVRFHNILTDNLLIHFIVYNVNKLLQILEYFNQAFSLATE